MTTNSLHDLARNVLAEFDLDIPTVADKTSLVERMVGNLRVSGFSDPISKGKDLTVAEGILRSMILRYRNSKKLAEAYAKAHIDTVLKTAASVAAEATTAVVADNTSDKFLEIEALMKKGLCPRCKTSMAPVKLHKYQIANFCSGCRTTVWKN